MRAQTPIDRPAPENGTWLLFIAMPIDAKTFSDTLAAISASNPTALLQGNLEGWAGVYLPGEPEETETAEPKPQIHKRTEA